MREHEEGAREQRRDSERGLQGAEHRARAPLGVARGCRQYDRGEAESEPRDDQRDVGGDAPPGRPDKDKPLIALSGSRKVPYLVDPDRGISLAGTDAILTYLEETYGAK